MKAQLSAEYLLLLVVGLALLGISITALVQISELEKKENDVLFLNTVAQDVLSISNEVCILGDGNKRIYSIGKEVFIECNGNEIIFSMNETEVKKEGKCSFSCPTREYSSLEILNDYGVIVFS